MNLHSPPMRTHQLSLRPMICRLSALLAASALVLAGCSSSSDNAAAPTVVPSTFTLSGTAATGAPLPTGTVITAKCAKGTGTVTLAAGGSFTLDISTGTAPCMLQAVTPATPGPSQTFYGIATAAGTVNITPLTDAVVEHMAGGDAASAFTNWGGTFDHATITTAKLKEGKDALIDYLTKTGYTMTGVGDFLTQNFAADSVSPYDKLLDALAAAKVPKSVLMAQARSTKRLTDTGQTTCYDTSTSATIACTLTAAKGQDGAEGLDADSKTNASTDGAAGFSYTKISSAGLPLAAGATSWDCIKDNITGLMWENKTSDSTLRGSAHTYAWYSTDAATNGGNAGGVGTDTCSATLANGQCNTKAYVTAINAAALCGKTDWRMPTITELGSLHNIGATASPYIDSTYFPNTSAQRYWSATSLVNGMSYSAGWGIRFDQSAYSLTNGVKTNTYSVRLVRSN